MAETCQKRWVRRVGGVNDSRTTHSSWPIVEAVGMILVAKCSDCLTSWPGSSGPPVPHGAPTGGRAKTKCTAWVKISDRWHDTVRTGCRSASSSSLYQMPDGLTDRHDAQHIITLESALNRILEEPGPVRSRDELVAGMRSVFVDPHVVFYRIVQSNIEIARALRQLKDVVSASSVW
jgi:plasmid stabilization system protein ParE